MSLCLHHCYQELSAVYGSNTRFPRETRLRNVFLSDLHVTALSFGIGSSQGVLQVRSVYTVGTRVHTKDTPPCVYTVNNTVAQVRK